LDRKKFQLEEINIAISELIANYYAMPEEMDENMAWDLYMDRLEEEYRSKLP
jgi:hypothetical protein